MKIKDLLFLLIALLCTLCSGCVTIGLNHWEQRANEIQFEIPEVNSCEERANILSQEMAAARVPHSMVYGRLYGRGHVWIELDGQIIEPSDYDAFLNARGYKESFRFTVRPGSKVKFSGRMA